jgi:hypothetical protein
MKRRPTKLVIMGVPYKIVYCNKPSDVDPQNKNEVFTGMHDPWKRTIYVYVKDQPEEEIWRIIIHEFLHAVGDLGKLKSLDYGNGNQNRKHSELECLSTAIADFLFRNKLFKLERR